MRQGGDAFAEHGAIATDIPRAHLEQIVEGAGNHVALLDLRDLSDGAVKGPKRGLCRAAQPDLDKRDMLKPHLRRVQPGLEALNETIVDQSLQSRLTRRLGQADPFRQVGHGDAAILAKNLEDGAVNPVKFTEIAQFAAHISCDPPENRRIALVNPNLQGNRLPVMRYSGCEAGGGASDDRIVRFARQHSHGASA